jgi:hypothetical protein
LGWSDLTWFPGGTLWFLPGWGRMDTDLGNWGLWSPSRPYKPLGNSFLEPKGGLLRRRLVSLWPLASGWGTCSNTVGYFQTRIMALWWRIVWSQGFVEIWRGVWDFLWSRMLCFYNLHSLRSSLSADILYILEESGGRSRYS